MEFRNYTLACPDKQRYLEDFFENWVLIDDEVVDATDGKDLAVRLSKLKSRFELFVFEREDERKIRILCRNGSNMLFYFIVWKKELGGGIFK